MKDVSSRWDDAHRLRLCVCDFVEGWKTMADISRFKLVPQQPTFHFYKGGVKVAEVNGADSVKLTETIDQLRTSIWGVDFRDDRDWPDE